MPTRAATRKRQQRKKACDLCFNKKIKCDLGEPTCSNCITYNAECRHDIVRHRAHLATRMPSTGSKLKKSTLARQNTDNPPLLISRGDVSTHNSELHHGSTTSEQSPLSDRVVDHATAEPSGASSWSFDPVQPTLYHGSADTELCLPSLHQLMPIVDHYFQAVNPSLPLFDQLTITRTVTKWFGTAPKRDAASWVAVLVILALGLQAMDPNDDAYFETLAGEGCVSYCLRNAQAVLPTLAMRDGDLLAVQVALALASLYRNALDLRPAGLLMSMAIRMVFRMQLHSQHSSRYFTFEENQQRSDVFWSAYVLDKCISLKLKEPSLLLDSEVDIPLPPRDASGHKAGVIQTYDGLNQLNIFWHTVSLAQIQGKVYSLLLSSTSLHLAADERQERVESVQKMMNEWYQQIPTAFGMNNLANNMASSELAQLSHLYHAYLLCLVCAHGVWESQTGWRQSIGSLGRAAVEDVAVILHGSRVFSACAGDHNPPLQHGWDQCVNVARQTMLVFRQSPRTQSLIWQSGCAHYSAMIVLLANTTAFSAPLSEVQEDLRLASESITLYSHLLHGLKSPLHDALVLITQDLHRLGQQTVALRQAEESDDTGLALIATGDAGVFYDFLPGSAVSDVIGFDEEFLSGRELMTFGNQGNFVDP